MKNNGACPRSDATAHNDCRRRRGVLSIPEPISERPRHMEHSRLLVFAITYFVALAMPGPGVAALLGRVLARGIHGAPAFIAGTVLGGLAWFAIAATGLAM